MVGEMFCSGDRLCGEVDPGCGRELRRCWRLPDEALGVGGVGSGQDFRSLLLTVLGAALVDVGWSVEAYPRVPVLLVVPVEEVLAEATSVLLAAELGREVWPVLERLELSL